MHNWSMLGLTPVQPPAKYAEKKMACYLLVIKLIIVDAVNAIITKTDTFVNLRKVILIIKKMIFIL